ncbi:hypothetical protein P7C73_g4411, partial [Tremellales sp. Uapishka_1]
MSLAARSPRKRMSMSLQEHNLNLDNMTIPITEKGFKFKKRSAVSIGGEGLGKFGFSTGSATEEMSPRRKARRSMQPRKSILKSLPLPSATSSTALTEDTTETFTRQYANTINFTSASQRTMDSEDADANARKGRLSLARRVSFAPSAHVRMFETNTESLSASTSAIPQSGGHQSKVRTGPRPSNSSHSRRSSIAYMQQLAQPPANIFMQQGEEQGEESMDLETESEGSDDDDGNGLSGFSGEGGPFTFGAVPSASGELDAEGEEEDEDEMEMEETQVVFGGIMRRASMAQSVMSEDSEREDEEKTMDFTIAIGGMMPNSPPVGAYRDRNSIGYTVPGPPGEQTGPILLPGEGEDDDDGMEFEETIAMGGILVDDTMSSDGDSSMGGREKTMTFSLRGDGQDTIGMDFTIAQGGIIDGFSAETQAGMDFTAAIGGIAHQEDTGRMDLTVAAGGIAQAPPTPRSHSRNLPTNTRPMSGTPSFARPTASSASKTKTTEKRNIFAPSPSPFKSTTPRKSGMDTAGEVAKRLSFGSATSSVGKKRVREEEAAEGEGSVKRGKSMTEEIFGTPSVSKAPAPRKSFLLPGNETAAPRKSFLFAKDTEVPALATSPARRKSVGPAPAVASAPYSEPEQEPEIAEDEVDMVVERQEEVWEGEIPTIPLATFLEMAGVGFIDNLPGINKRRKSAVSRSVLGTSYNGGDRDFPLHEFTAAHLYSIYINMYEWASGKMAADIQEGLEALMQTEAHADLHNPPVIQEYLSASDEDRPLFEMTFKNFKRNVVLKARERWYDWKSELMKTMKPNVEAVWEGMKEDDAHLTQMKESSDTLLPDLRARHAALVAELDSERMAVKEIEACDQDQVNDLRAAIEEQTAQIQVFSSELAETTSKLEKLDGQLSVTEAKKAEHLSAVSAAKSSCDQYTRSDVTRLQEEYNSLQQLHLWRPMEITPGGLSLTFDDEIKVSFASTDYVPTLRSALVEMTSESKDTAATVNLFEMFKLMIGDLECAKGCSTLPSFIQKAGQLWTASQRLRAEFRLVHTRYPMTYRVTDDIGSFMATATMMLPNVQSKIRVSFEISRETMWHWPGSIAKVESSVEVVYGSADADLLSEAARLSIERATDQGYLGCFLQTCFEVEAQY